MKRRIPVKRLSINVMGKAHAFLVDEEDASFATEALGLMEKVIMEIEADPKRPSQPDAIPVVACFRLAADLLRTRAELGRIENIVKGWRSMEGRDGAF